MQIFLIIDILKLWERCLLWSFPEVFEVMNANKLVFYCIVSLLEYHNIENTFSLLFIITLLWGKHHWLRHWHLCECHCRKVGLNTHSKGLNNKRAQYLTTQKNRLSFMPVYTKNSSNICLVPAGLLALVCENWSIPEKEVVAKIMVHGNSDAGTHHKIRDFKDATWKILDDSH